jgi:UDP-N-acetylmuramoyl-tripeptide--D-alanyl-D-alanine ligase
MIPISVRALETLGLGELVPGSISDQITGLQIDSRLIRPGDLFVAIRGGRAFVDEARDRGATTLVPNDEFAAMAILGEVLRASSSARFVGITGSTGKTSTKDILAALCAPVARTVATEASYNAELGVPLTLGRLEPDTEVCIVEMGMRGFGQITELCKIARPDIGVVTAIGPVHLELVGSVDGVARSKAELVAALPEDGIAVVPKSADLEPHLRDDIDVRRVGPVDVELLEDGAHVAFGGARIRFPFTSRHQAQNALTAMMAYEALGLPLERLPESAATVLLSPWRGEELPLPGGGFVINDAYNANPTSLEAALRHLAERGAGRRLVAILGGMAELGEHTERHHRELAELTAELEIEVIAVGDVAHAYGFDAWTPDADAALEAARALVKPGDAVLVKASRSVALEGIAPALANPTAW